MFAVENEKVLHASPPKVWTALTRFDDYARWNLFIRIVGPLALGATVQYSFRTKSHKPWFFTVDARVIALEAQRQIAFRFGLGWLIAFEESYSVEPVPVGSRLVHGFRCTGLLSALNFKKMSRNFSELLEATDRGIQRHLSPARPPSSAKKHARKGFRPNG